MPYQIKNGIVYGSNAVSLTQAQYDALSTAEKNNGTVYYIYDVDDIYSGNVVKNIVLSASKWASNAYTITDPDITGANIVFLTYPPSTSDEVYSAIQSANIRVTNQTNGSITLQALGGAPSINLTVTLIIQGIDMGLQTAEYVTYDNSTSGLEAVNVQEAVDELNNGLTTITTKSYSLSVGSPTTLLGQNLGYGDVNIENDIQQYGDVVSCRAVDNASVPAFVSLLRSGTLCRVISISSYSATRTATLTITYASRSNA